MKTIQYEEFFHPDYPFHIADTVFGDNKKTQPHDHDFYEFFILKEGSLIHEINGNFEEKSGKYLFFIHPEDTHSFKKGKGSENAVITNIAFTSAFLEEILCFLFGEDFRVFLHSFPKTVELSDNACFSLLEKIILLNDFTGRIRISRMKNLVAEMFLWLQTQPEEAGGNVPAWLYNALSSMKKKENFIAGLGRFIEISGKSQEHLTRMMKKYYHITPTEAVNRFRLNHTARLLTGSGISVLDAALRSGFNNMAHFNRLFREQFGMNPSGYRKIGRIITDPR